MKFKRDLKSHSFKRDLSIFTFYYKQRLFSAQPQRFWTLLWAELHILLQSCLNSESHLPKKNCVICFIESPLKMVKNAFYFILKLLSFSRYLSFCHDFWSCRKNGLIRKIMLTSKFMTSEPGQEAIEIYILPSISRSKDNQTMKLGRIEYNERNVFLQKLCRKWGSETSFRPLLIFKKA